MIFVLPSLVDVIVMFFSRSSSRSRATSTTAPAACVRSSTMTSRIGADMRPGPGRPRRGPSRPGTSSSRKTRGKFSGCRTIWTMTKSPSLPVSPDSKFRLRPGSRKSWCSTRRPLCLFKDCPGQGGWDDPGMFNFSFMFLSLKHRLRTLGYYATQFLCLFVYFEWCPVGLPCSKLLIHVADVTQNEL